MIACLVRSFEFGSCTWLEKYNVVWIINLNGFCSFDFGGRGLC